MPTTVAFVGLGNMGRPMAERLLGAGFGLRVHNRTAERGSGLAERGATLCASPAEAARGAEVVVSMLSDDEALAATALGDDGFVAGMPPGALHLSMSTVSPDVNRRLLAEHGKHGGELVAAPVMGRPDVAAAGQLWILAAGRPELEERCRPLFGALGRGHTWLGDDPGLANVAKITANFMLLSVVEMTAEAFTLVEKQGLGREQFFAIAKMLLPAPAFEGYAGRMLGGQFTPAGFSVPLALKDAELALGLARLGRSPLPTAGVVRDRLLAALARDRADWDLSGLVQVARESAGLD